MNQTIEREGKMSESRNQANQLFDSCRSPAGGPIEAEAKKAMALAYVGANIGMLAESLGKLVEVAREAVRVLQTVLPPLTEAAARLGDGCNRDQDGNCYGCGEPEPYCNCIDGQQDDGESNESC
jgi:hypothetical protein